MDSHSDADRKKHVVRDLIHRVWIEGDLDALPEFWTDDCINHAAPPRGNRGLAALREYHASFASAFNGLSKVSIEITQQIAEGDRVVTCIATRADHTGAFAGIAATGGQVMFTAIRIDQLRDGRVAQHWSVSDFAAMLQQLQH